MRTMTRMAAICIGVLLLACCSDYAIAPRPDGGGDDDTVEDGGPDGDVSPDGTDASDGDGGHCTVPEPQPLFLSVEGDSCTGCDMERADWALVVFSGEAAGGDHSEVWLLFDDGSLLKVEAGLPGGRRVPLVAGNRVYVLVNVDSPWWTNQDVTIVSEEDIVVFGMRRREHEIEEPLFMCPPRQEECGIKGYPLMDTADGMVGQGSAYLFELGRYTLRYLIGRFYQYEQLQCDDVPRGWLEMAVVTSFYTGQCPCHDDADCMLGELCEPSARRCVPDLCAAMDCPEDKVCDPFRGKCVERPADGCRNDSDCDDTEICNRFTGHCVEDSCKILDCSPCGSLSGGCRGCFDDCDCDGGKCDRRAGMCTDGCDSARIQLSRENPEGYTRYQVCFDGRLADPSELAARYDPGLDCRPGQPEVKCPSDGRGCAGRLDTTPSSMSISWESWKRLCRLSRNPLVVGISGLP